MSQQIQITGGAKVRNLEGVLTGTAGVVNALGINVPSGIPQLDGSGKILVSQLPNSVMEYKGTWNAATNTPTLADGTGNQGDVYLCNVAGTANFGSGPIAFFVGDQVIYSGTIWQRASGATGTVTSVAVTESGDSLNVTGSPITTSGTINIGFNGNSGQYINGQGNLTTFPSLAGYVTSVTATAPLLSSGGTTPDLSIPAASASVDGYLDNADWTTFNNKQNAITLTTTGTSGVSTLIGSTLNIPNYSTDLSGYVPYTGATANVNLGTFDLTADVITGATGSFASNGGSNTFAINHSSGSGIALNITKGGNGEGLYINKTSGSGNAATIIGTLNATTLVKSGGTSSQFLKADGSVDASAYITLTTLSGGVGISYNNTTGVITNSAPDQTVSLTAGAGISISGTYPSFTIASTITQYTDALARAALSFAAGSGAYNSTTGVITIPTNNNQITNGSNFITLTSLSAGAGISYNNTTGAISSTITQYTDALARASISLTTTGTSGAATYNSTTGVLNVPNYAGGVTSVFGRTGAVLAVSGDYNTDLVTEGTTNLYFTNARSRASISLTTAGTSGSSVYNSTTGVLNVPSYTLAGLGGQPQLNGTGFVVMTGTTVSYDNSIYAIGLAANITNNSDLNAAGRRNGMYRIDNGLTSAPTTSFWSMIQYGNQNNVVGQLASEFQTGETYIRAFNSVWSSWRKLWDNVNLANPIGGTGTTNRITKFTSSTSIGDSVIREVSGNLGIGVTPPSWLYFRSINIDGSSLAAAGSSAIALSRNWYYENAEKYYENGTAQRLELVLNGFYFNTAVNNTSGAGASLTWNTPMSLLGNGNLLLGSTTDAGYRLDVNGTSRFIGELNVAFTNAITSIRGGTGYSILRLYAGNGTSVDIVEFQIRNRVDGSDISSIGNFSNHDLQLRTGNINRLTIAASTGSSTFYTIDPSGNRTNPFTAMTLVADNPNAPYNGFGTALLFRNMIYTGGPSAGGIRDGARIRTSINTNSVSNAGTDLIFENTPTGSGALQTVLTLDYGRNAIFNGGVIVGGGVSGGGTVQVQGNVNINGVFQINGTTIGGGGGSGVTGTGTTNYLTKWTGSSTLGNSGITDNGSTIRATTQFVQGSGDARSTSGTTIALNLSGATYSANNDPGDGGRFLSIVNDSSATNAFSALSYRVNSNGGTNNAMLDVKFVNTNSQSGTLYWTFLTPGGFQDRMALNSAGNLLLGTTTDNGYRINLNGSISYAFGFLSIFRGSTGANDIFVGNQGTRFYIGGNTYVEGSVTALGGFFDTSDSRLKIVVKDYEQPKGIENVAARMYVKNSRKELGYFAQDLQEILPSAVIEGEDGFLTLSYSQVHTAKIAYLEKEVAELKELIKSLVK